MGGGHLPDALASPRVITLGGPDAPLAIDRAEMLRYLGHTGQDIDEELAARIERVTHEAACGARARCVIAAFPVDARSLDPAGEPCIRLTGTVAEFTGRDVYRHLKDARWCAAMACTLGMDNERELRRRGATSTLEAALFDAASSALVEAAVEHVDRMVRAEAAAAGLSCNWRFSCGYGDCPLQAQGPLLATLDTARRIGLTVTPSDLMIPSKSVSALMGIFEGPARSTDAPARCSICRMRSGCTLRARGLTC